MHFDINQLIEQYGYLAVVIGCIAEGETFALLGGVIAHEKLLRYSGVVLAVALGGFLGDQLLFWIGRRFGTRILRRFKKHQGKLKRANSMIRRHPVLFIIGVRFMYGFRTIGPIIIGASRLRPMKFLIFNAIGAFLWAVIFVTLGYFAGEMIAPWLHRLDHHLKHLLWLVGAALLVLLLRMAFRHWSSRRHND
ncbi:MAG: DedA family protein [Mixta calida]|mgnify:FL=1|uniref:DedA family protein n=1 Tax=Mixta calida TaxID=665913 RepID=A0ABN5H7Q3_9GAMM|nr:MULTISPECIES: DedA family protein [Mixta]AIX74362.1 membrane protein [Pantoea sp. PSNIH2]MBS6059974.1 DedA family protein [Pantoea sp.]POU50934.1 DedA family protein [Pantoea sp. PSNIH5]POU68769.1 DedA family protein [Pantoea sp. PSNIH4]POY68918.1 DedA family protein [Pantoea sp. PSNIH3]